MVDATGTAPRRLRAKARRGARVCRRVRLFETLIRNNSPPANPRWGADQSETTVLMVLLLAFWRWLLPAPAMQAPWATAGASPFASLLAMRGRCNLAPIPVPLRRLLS
jgi:hypothetical protein